jgi:hypothetical protein
VQQLHAVEVLQRIRQLQQHLGGTVAQVRWEGGGQGGCEGSKGDTIGQRVSHAYAVEGSGMQFADHVSAPTRFPHFNLGLC